MRFLVDQCVDVRVARRLREEGHDAVHLRDLGLQRLPNGEIFSKAAREDRVVITFDLDFGEIVGLAAGQPVTIILFRLRNTRLDHVLERLRLVLSALLSPGGAPAIVLVEDARVRIRRYPHGP